MYLSIYIYVYIFNQVSFFHFCIFAFFSFLPSTSMASSNDQSNTNSQLSKLVPIPANTLNPIQSIALKKPCLLKNIKQSTSISVSSSNALSESQSIPLYSSPNTPSTSASCRLKKKLSTLTKSFSPFQKSSCTTNISSSSSHQNSKSIHYASHSLNTSLPKNKNWTKAPSAGLILSENKNTNIKKDQHCSHTNPFPIESVSSCFTNVDANYLKNENPPVSIQAKRPSLTSRILFSKAQNGCSSLKSIRLRQKDDKSKTATDNCSIDNTSSHPNPPPKVYTQVNNSSKTYHTSSKNIQNDSNTLDHANPQFNVDNKASIYSHQNNLNDSVTQNLQNTSTSISLGTNTTLLPDPLLQSNSSSDNASKFKKRSSTSDYPHSVNTGYLTELQHSTDSNAPATVITNSSKSSFCNDSESNSSAPATPKTNPRKGLKKDLQQNETPRFSVPNTTSSFRSGSSSDSVSKWMSNNSTPTSLSTPLTSHSPSSEKSPRCRRASLNNIPSFLSRLFPESLFNSTAEKEMEPQNISADSSQDYENNIHQQNENTNNNTRFLQPSESDYLSYPSSKASDNNNPPLSNDPGNGLQTQVNHLVEDTNSTTSSPVSIVLPTCTEQKVSLQPSNSTSSNNTESTTSRRKSTKSSNRTTPNKTKSPRRKTKRKIKRVRRSASTTTTIPSLSSFSSSFSPSFNHSAPHLISPLTKTIRLRSPGFAKSANKSTHSFEHQDEKFQTPGTDPATEQTIQRKSKKQTIRLVPRSETWSPSTSVTKIFETGNPHSAQARIIPSHASKNYYTFGTDSEEEIKSLKAHNGNELRTYKQNPMLIPELVSMVVRHLYNMVPEPEEPDTKKPRPISLRRAMMMFDYEQAIRTWIWGLPETLEDYTSTADSSIPCDSNNEFSQKGTLLQCMLVNKLWYEETNRITNQRIHFQSNPEWQKFVKCNLFNSIYKHSWPYPHEEPQKPYLKARRPPQGLVYRNFWKPKALIIHQISNLSATEICSAFPLWCMSELKILELYGCSYLIPPPVLFQGGQLTCIILPGCFNLTDTVLAYIAQHCPNLQHLDIRACPLVTDESMVQVAQHCPNLSLLNIGRNSEGYKITGISVSMIARHTSITTLGLAGCDVDNASIWELVEFRGQYLERLSLNNCPLITSNSFPAALGYTPNLCVLELRGIPNLEELSPSQAFTIVGFKKWRESQGLSQPFIRGSDEFERAVREVEWNLEMDAVAERILRDDQGYVSQKLNGQQGA